MREGGVKSRSRDHSHVEVLIQEGAISEEEAPEGPIMIQGDHGPVAFRKIEIREFKDLDIAVNGFTDTPSMIVYVLGHQPRQKRVFTATANERL